MNFDADVNNLCTEEMDAIVGGGDIITNNLVENGVPYATSIGPVVFNGLVFATNTLPNKVESATHTAVTTVSNAVGNATNWISSWF